MRDYAQYTATPMKSRKAGSTTGSTHSVPNFASSRHHGMVTPSPSTTTASSSHNHVYTSSYTSATNTTKVRSQVEILKDGGASTSTTNTVSTSGANEQLLDNNNSDSPTHTNSSNHNNHNHHHPTPSSSHQVEQRPPLQQQSPTPNNNKSKSPHRSNIPPPQHHHHHHHHPDTHVHATRATSQPVPPPQLANNNTAVSSPSRSTTSHTSKNSNHHHASSLTAADALSLRRDGPEATIGMLRASLEQATAKDVADKTQLAKSDATILELRSSVRQLKRQLEKVDQESRHKHAQLQEAKRALHDLQKVKPKNHNNHNHNNTTNTNNSSDNQSWNSDPTAHAMAKEERVGELQVELDRAHAQLLTADMVRQELEDTLEAEQYTWELRVQDQERTIVELQQDCATLAEDLEDCRRQWKQAETTWANDIADLQQQLEAAAKQTTGSRGVDTTMDEKKDDRDLTVNHDVAQGQRIDELQTKLRQVEEERNELQTCLDEALQELEAVDAELGSHTPEEVEQLRADNQRLKETVERQKKFQEQQQLQMGDEEFDTLEGLQHLYRWLLEQKDENDTNTNTSQNGSQVAIPQTHAELLDAIHHELEILPTLGNGSSQKSSLQADASEHAALAQTVAELQAQLTDCKGDLQAREESSSELRASLKEAVALIKPLQDAVDKADRQKVDLQQEVERLRSTHEEETGELHKELREAHANLARKETELSRLKQDVHRLQMQLDEAKDLAKAREALHGLSPTAAAAAAAAKQQQEQNPHMSKARQDLMAKRAQEQTLRALLRDAQSRFSTLNHQAQTVEARNAQLQGQLKEAEDQLHSGRHSFDNGSANSASATAEQVTALQQEVSKLTSELELKTTELEDLRQRPAELSPEMKEHIQSLEEQATQMIDELKKKKETEKTLNRSLKEALSLLKPMQTHLEDAEEENRELTKEVKILRRKLTAMEISGMGSVMAKTPPTSPSRAAAAAQQPRSPQHLSPARDKADNGNDKAAMLAASNEALRREKKELEETICQLEQENSQLHDALEEMSRVNNNANNTSAASNQSANSKTDVRLKEEIVELKSRYEVTQSRLKDAYSENRTLVDALKEKEDSEKDAIEGMRILREKLRRTEMDLDNAKYIATSALVKVESLKALDNNLSMNSAFERAETHTIHSLEEKAIELELMAAKAVAAQVSASPLPSNSSSPRHKQVAHHSAGSNTATTWAGKRSRLADF